MSCKRGGHPWQGNNKGREVLRFIAGWRLLAHPNIVIIRKINLNKKL